ncbi:MAG: amidohydrolase family protein, partial [Betaproteobacteria bacterium]|nr:amidohydrolase family protein [Betaproteobacteria bacterium]
GLLEVIALSAATGAPVHVAHIQSSGQGSTSRMLQIIQDARSHGLDVTTECYPYTTGATRIESFLFDTWHDRPDADYAKLQWMKTGERLTRESFRRYREQGGLVLIHANTEDVVRAAVASPLTMIASDGFDVSPGEGHPRSAGTFSRILGRYVREETLLTLPQALAKMTLEPARRLQGRVPSMRNKGRIREGADADITIFDAARIADRATYEQPDRYSEGIEYVLVEGEAVVFKGRFNENLRRGRAIRAPQR